MLLTPGVFLRIGENSQISLISPSLTNTQFEVSRGEVMLEATGLVKDQSIQIVNHGSSPQFRKTASIDLPRTIHPPLLCWMGKRLCPCRITSLI